MLDLITFRGPDFVNERASAAVVAAFRDSEEFTNQQPTNVYYRLDDESGVNLIDWTSVTAPVDPANSVSIVLTPEQNRILNEAREVERKFLSVMTDRGLATQFVGSFVYKVRNMGWPS